MLRALTWLEKLRIFLQISNKFASMFYVTDNSFGQIDPFYPKILISSVKNNARIACVQLIELTFPHK